METVVKIVKNVKNGFRRAKMQKTVVKVGKTIVNETGAFCGQIDAEIMKTAQKRAYKLRNGVKTAFRLVKNAKTVVL